MDRHDHTDLVGTGIGNKGTRAGRTAPKARTDYTTTARHRLKCRGV